ncbi:hypothetical protein DL95DRAFT_439396 [Leptodontidium sp. 2 PMI_412]|nr:hypothetical protein DL95DRAFT_439396 [Leptodontidium sp. 2 PMI_412]
MNDLLTRKKLLSSLRGKLFKASFTSFSDQKLRDVKSSFISKSELDTIATSKSLCRTLLETKQTFPNDSLVVRDISLLIVHSYLKILIESTRPQPDYSVVFRRGAFTEDQLKRIEPFVGELTNTSFFIATYFIYFLFLTYEVKCSAIALNIIDRQNVHSITIAREKELYREILAFSISHDYSTVRIYGYYPIIDRNKTTFYRHPIRKFDFTELNMPTHLKRIYLVIDGLPPNINFNELESHYLSN